MTTLELELTEVAPRDAGELDQQNPFEECSFEDVDRHIIESCLTTCTWGFTYLCDSYTTTW
ncbi:MAG TPA: hypothetical protein VGM10_10490 [Actinocrinis sp.]|jgi:hypothetical protein